MTLTRRMRQQAKMDAIVAAAKARRDAERDAHTAAVSEPGLRVEVRYLSHKPFTGTVVRAEHGTFHSVLDVIVVQADEKPYPWSSGEVRYNAAFVFPVAS